MEKEEEIKKKKRQPKNSELRSRKGETERRTKEWVKDGADGNRIIGTLEFIKDKSEERHLSGLLGEESKFKFIVRKYWNCFIKFEWYL